MDLTIIIPCRNEAKHIERFLDSLLSQDMNGMSWEAIVADGMSGDGTRQIVDRYSSRCPAIRRIDNPGQIVSTGLNRAIAAARGEFILRMDMHTEYAPDYVRRCVETLLTTGADNVGGPARTRAKGYLARAIAAAYHSRFACGGARFHDDNYEGLVDTVTYGCWRKSTLERLGLFDEDLVRNQDDELNLRTVRAGGRVWQSPAIISWYSPRSTLPNLMRQYFQYGFWKIPVIRKHRIPASWRHLAPGAFVLGNIALLLGGMSLWVAGQRQAAGAMLTLWALVFSFYLAACAVASLIAGRRHGWDLLPVLPVVFPCYHFSYGSGFLSGLIYWPFAKGRGASGKLFSEITR